MAKVTAKEFPKNQTYRNIILKAAGLLLGICTLIISISYLNTDQ